MGDCSTTTNIYIACRCWDEHPERIVANDMRRDGGNQPQHDSFAVGLDTFHDGRNGFLFGVTADRRPAGRPITDERPNFDWNGDLGRQDDDDSTGLDRWRWRIPFKIAALHGRAAADLGHSAPPVHPPPRTNGRISRRCRQRGASRGH